MMFFRRPAGCPIAPFGLCLDGFVTLLVAAALICLQAGAGWAQQLTRLPPVDEARLFSPDPPPPRVFEPASWLQRGPVTASFAIPLSANHGSWLNAPGVAQASAWQPDDASESSAVVTLAQQPLRPINQVTPRDLEAIQHRLNELESFRIANEDATRTIIRQSFAERGSNITDVVVFGGTLEALAGWAKDFEGQTESDIILNTAQFDFEVQVNSWTLGSLILEYDDGTDLVFPTTENTIFSVDRINVDTAFLAISDSTRWPALATFGRNIVPFGISTGDPVADVL